MEHHAVGAPHLPMEVDCPEVPPGQEKPTDAPQSTSQQPEAPDSTQRDRAEHQESKTTSGEASNDTQGEISSTVSAPEHGMATKEPATHQEQQHEPAELVQKEDNITNDTDGAEESASGKRARSPSPDDEPDHMAQPPPRPTIRLDVTVNPEGTSKRDYIVNIPRMAVNRLKGKHPKWAAWYSSTYLDSGVEASVPDAGISQRELSDLGGLAKLLQKYPSSSGSSSNKRRRHDDYDVGSYDTKDPFVDDSELAFDEPAFCVKMRTNGFYVAVGPVEFETKEKYPNSSSSSAFRSSLANSKGVSQRIAGYAGLTNKLLAKRAASQKQKPDAESDKGESATETKQGEPESATTPDTSDPKLATQEPAPEPASKEEPKPAGDPADAKSKKNKYPTRPVHPQLQQMFDNLKGLVQRASFAVKSKFPPELKPPLIETAKLAVELDEYNENFFNYLPSIFPYNRFTMMKLTKREFFHKHMEYYRELQEEHLDALYGQMRESLPEQEAEYNAAMAEWCAKGNESKPKESAPTADDTMTAENDPDVTHDAAPGDEPVKRFRWSEPMREELFTIVTVENAMSEIRNEKLCVES